MNKIENKQFPDLADTPRTQWAWKCCELHGPATRAVQMTKFAEALEIELAELNRRFSDEQCRAERLSLAARNLLGVMSHMGLENEGAVAMMIDELQAALRNQRPEIVRVSEDGDAL